MGYVIGCNLDSLFQCRMNNHDNLALDQQLVMDNSWTIQLGPSAPRHFP